MEEWCREDLSREGSRGQGNSRDGEKSRDGGGEWRRHECLQGFNHSDP